jgi:hypothetical protein
MIFCVLPSTPPARAAVATAPQINTASAKRNVIAFIPLISIRQLLLSTVLSQISNFKSQITNNIRTEESHGFH